MPRRSALISGDDMKRRYNDNCNSDNPQKTTCSYLTGTIAPQKIRMRANRLRRLTIFREEVIGPPYNELGDKTTEFFELFLAFGLGFIAGHRVTTPNDAVLVVLPKVILRA